MWKAVSGLLAVCLVGTLAAQWPAATPAFLSDSEIKNVRQSATGDVQMIVTDAGKYNIGLATMKRLATGKPESAIVHSQVTEVYYITDGSGSLRVGGSVAGAQSLSPDNNVVKVLAGPTTMGGAISGGERRRVAKGDFIVIPAGVQHSFDSIDGSIEYLMVRVDGDKVLPAGLVNEFVATLRAK